jgi:hypothetical protein
MVDAQMITSSVIDYPRSELFYWAMRSMNTRNIFAIIRLIARGWVVHLQVNPKRDPGNSLECITSIFSIVIARDDSQAAMLNFRLLSGQLLSTFWV